MPGCCCPVPVSDCCEVSGCWRGCSCSKNRGHTSGGQEGPHSGAKVGKFRFRKRCYLVSICIVAPMLPCWWAMSPVLSKTRSGKSSPPQLPGFRICQGISLWWECFAWRWDLPGIGGRFFGHVIESPEPLKVFGLGPEELETAHGRVIHRFGSHLGQRQLETKVSTRSGSHQETWIGFIHSSCLVCVPNVASFMMFYDVSFPQLALFFFEMRWVL